MPRVCKVPNLSVQSPSNLLNCIHLLRPSSFLYSSSWRADAAAAVAATSLRRKIKCAVSFLPHLVPMFLALILHPAACKVDDKVTLFEGEEVLVKDTLAHEGNVAADFRVRAHHMKLQHVSYAAKKTCALVKLEKTYQSILLLHRPVMVHEQWVAPYVQHHARPLAAPQHETARVERVVVLRDQHVRLHNVGLLRREDAHALVGAQLELLMLQQVLLHRGVGEDALLHLEVQRHDYGVQVQPPHP